MPVGGPQIRVRNLREFRDALEQTASGLPAVLRQANRGVADFVVDRATSRARGTGRLQARAAEGLRASAGELSATVRLDGEKVPGALGTEFGAAHDVQRRIRGGFRLGWNQFDSWTGRSGEAGTFLFPTIRETRDEQLALYEEEIAGIMAGAFPDS